MTFAMTKFIAAGMGRLRTATAGNPCNNLTTSVNTLFRLCLFSCLIPCTAYLFSLSLFLVSLETLQ